MHSKCLLAAILAVSTMASAQTPPETPAGEAVVPVTYVGSNARVSLGINQDGDVLGEILGVLGKTDRSAFLAEVWLGHGGAGGVQFDYHWLRGDAERGGVWKAFAAGDQNAFKDRKATIGLGWERQDLFVDGYLMHATSGRRQVGSATDVVETLLNGSDANGDYTQLQTVTTLTNFFERPYEYGAGLRVGRYFDDALLRVRGGFDYERGKFDSDQWTVSLGAEKMIRNTGFSVALQGEFLRKSGQFETDRNDSRGWLLLRYEFGQSYRAREPFRMVQVERAEPAPAPAITAEPQVVRNEVRLDGDAFFAFDHFQLNAEAIAALDALVAKLASNQRVSRVAVVGHTDSVGSVAYNQKLSERRAASAKDYLVSRGIPADQIDARGEGKLNPRYPNDTAENRQRNRRVDVGFLTIEETVVPAAQPEPSAQQPKVEWVREPVEANPAWIERALRNPVEHKRTVDVYKFQESSTTTTLGDKQYADVPSVARDDVATVEQDSANNLIDVTANDSDPRGSALTVVQVSAPAHGTATIVGNQVAYTPAAGYSGSDSFTYTVRNDRGGTASATVTVTVNPTAPPLGPPPVAGPLSVAVLKGASLDIPVLTATQSPQGYALTVIEVRHTGPGLAELSINPDNTVHYQSIHGFSGNDSFEYTVSDGHGQTATGTVSVLVWEIAGHP